MEGPGGKVYGVKGPVEYSLMIRLCVYIGYISLDFIGGQIGQTHLSKQAFKAHAFGFPLSTLFYRVLLNCISLLQDHHNPTIPRHQHQSHLEQLEEGPLVPPLSPRIPPRIPRHVQIPPEGPSDSHHRGRDREAQARQQQGRQRRRLMLKEVGVRALRAVELERLRVGA